MKETNCPECESEHQTVVEIAENVPYGVEPNEHSVPVNLPLRTCLDCGKQFMTYEIDDIIDKAIVKYIAEKKRPTTRPHYGYLAASLMLMVAGMILTFGSVLSIDTDAEHSLLLMKCAVACVGVAAVTMSLLPKNIPVKKETRHV